MLDVTSVVMTSLMAQAYRGTFAMAVKWVEMMVNSVPGVLSPDGDKEKDSTIQLTTFALGIVVQG